METPFIIPIFIPQEGCPHQCVFCNQENITGAPSRLPSFKDIESEVNRFLTYAKNQPSQVQLAFYGGNFLGLKKNIIRYFMQIAQTLADDGKIQKIRFSTRPDTITIDRLETIKNPLVSTIEIGVQSMDNEVLNACGRGHTASDTRQASALLKSCPYEVGMQMMVGLPKDSEEKALATAREIITLSPNFVRIYPTIVLSESILGRWYEKGKYRPLSLEQCVLLVKKIYLLFNEHQIPVVRMGLQPSEELSKFGSIMAGPFHPSFGHLVYSEIFLDHLTDFVVSNSSNVSDLYVRVHPKNVSNARGHKNQNLNIIKEKHQISSISISEDKSLSENMMEINGTNIEVWKISSNSV